MSLIRVVLPHHLRNLARTGAEVELAVEDNLTIGAVLDALEARYPMLKGTIRDHVTLKRRPFLRFFVCNEDWSFEPYEKALPEAIASAQEPFIVIGAIAGG